MTSIFKSSRAIFVGFIAVLLLLIGVGLRIKTQASVAPPIYDPISYYSKSAYVWKAIHKGRINQIFNGGLSIRPPGTAFILYPFGFNASMKSFLFRSTFAPVAIWTLSLSVLMLPWIGRRRDILIGGALAAWLMSIPMFYHFEFSEAFLKIYFVTNQWGFVDGLEGAVGALGLALVVVGIARRSLALAIAGSLVGTYSVFIKPSGILVILVVMGVALTEFVVAYIRDADRRKELLKFAGIFYAAAISIAGAALWLCTHTEYLGHGNIELAKFSQSILIKLKEPHALLPLLNSLIRPVIGWGLFVPMVLALVFFGAGALGLYKGNERTAIALKLAMATMIAVAAVYWWRTMAGAEHRYLFPFILMLIAWFVPDVFRALQAAPGLFRNGVAAYGFLGFGMLAVLLFSPAPDFRLQSMLGVNLTSGLYGEEFKTGNWLIELARKRQKPLIVYSMTDTTNAGVIEMCDWVNRTKRPKERFFFDMRRPNNWSTKPGINVSDFLKCDFIMMGEATSKSEGPVKDWEDEVERFKVAITANGGPENKGLELVADGKAKIYRIADPEKLAGVIRNWASSLQWENDFYERNKAFFSNNNN